MWIEDEVPTKLTLVGFVRLIMESPGFHLPVFASSKDDAVKYVQDINLDGYVTRFMPITLHSFEIVQITQTEHFVQRVNERPLLIFESDPDSFRIGHRTHLKDLVRSRLNMEILIDKPFTRATLAAFCDEENFELAADLEALKFVSKIDNASEYYRLNVICRDRIRRRLPESINHINFRLHRDMVGIRVELPENTTEDELAAMRRALQTSQQDIDRIFDQINLSLSCGIKELKHSHDIRQCEKILDSVNSNGVFEIDLDISGLIGSVLVILNSVKDKGKNSSWRDYMERRNIIQRLSQGSFLPSMNYYSDLLSDVLELCVRLQANHSKVASRLSTTLLEVVDKLYQSYSEEFTHVLAFALYMEGKISRTRRNYDKAADLLKKSLSLYDEAGHRSFRDKNFNLSHHYALTLEELALIKVHANRNDEAMYYAQEAAAVRQHASARRVERRFENPVRGLLSVADLLDQRERSDEACKVTSLAITILREEAKRDTMQLLHFAMTLERSAYYLARVQLFDSALDAISEAIELRKSRSWRDSPNQAASISEALFMRTLIYLQMGYVDGARMSFLESEETLRLGAFPNQELRLESSRSKSASFSLISEMLNKYKEPLMYNIQNPGVPDHIYRTISAVESQQRLFIDQRKLLRLAGSSADSK